MNKTYKSYINHATIWWPRKLFFSLVARGGVLGVMNGSMRSVWGAGPIQEMV